MDDPDDEVRDWATSGIGTQAEESTAIIAALLNLTKDLCKNVRNEAIWGLAVEQIGSEVSKRMFG